MNCSIGALDKLPLSNRLLAELSRMGILQELTGRRRNRVFCFKEYFELFLK